MGGGHAWCTLLRAAHLKRINDHEIAVTNFFLELSLLLIYTESLSEQNLGHQLITIRFAPLGILMILVAFTTHNNAHNMF